MGRIGLLLDACVAINVHASGRLSHIASTLSLGFIVVSEAAREVRQLQQVVDGEVHILPIDLTAYEPEDLHVTQLDQSEYSTYVELAKVVDDGEAATIAVSQIRKIPMATDDRKARRVCREHGLPGAVSTLDILEKYATSSGLLGVEIAAMLTDVRRKASFRPRNADPHCAWWCTYLSLT